MRKNTKTFMLLALVAAFEPMILAFKWEVLVFVPSCYVLYGETIASYQIW